MGLREFFAENFAGDLEYHPLRAALYLGLGAVALAFWVFSSHDSKFTPIPLIAALGGIALLIKGIFFLRRSSDGLGVLHQPIDGSGPKTSGKVKNMQPVPIQIAQLLQDFGTGPVLLWPFINVGRNSDQVWVNPPHLKVFVSGAVIFGAGWVFRKLTVGSTEPVS